MNARRAIAAVGDVADVNCWSGIPWHFWRAAEGAGWDVTPCRLDLQQFGWTRRWWNAGRLLRGRRPGGFQFSQTFLAAAEAQVFAGERGRDTITFHQQFPRTSAVAGYGGRLMHYLDATFAGLVESGSVGNLTADVCREAAAVERENYAGATWVVTMARWAAESAVRDCGVPAARVRTILPGANVDLPADYSFPCLPGLAGRDRPLVLGFVGKDWRRKGLPFLLEVRSALERMGVQAVVRIAGHCPEHLRRGRGVEYAGFIDKAGDAPRFLGFLAGCDLGCLFSSHEPLGISTLEFLRAGIPVAGFAVEGLADTLPPEAGLAFQSTQGAAEVAGRIREVFTEEGSVARLRVAARHCSPRVTWERCVAEWSELLEKGEVSNPVQLWKTCPPTHR